MLANPSTDFYDEDDEYDDDDDYENDDQGVDGIKITATRGDDDGEDEGFDDEDEDGVTMNEEGSGQGRFGKGYDRFRTAAYKNRMKMDYLEKVRRKEQKAYGVDALGPGVDALGPGVDAESDEDERGGSGNGMDDQDDDDSFFSSKRKSNSRYFRKNTNDAIKIISTPLGKVGIVYQQTDDKKDDTARTIATDFETNRQYPKITPVLTADGKVALLYRGDSASTKYEPILNMTHKFNLYDNKTRLDKHEDGGDEDEDVDEGYDEEDGDDDVIGQTTETLGVAAETATPSPVAPGTLDVDSDNSILPMINRPLSEVLGIKKNQFRQFRIKDDGLTTMAPKPQTENTVNLGGYAKMAPNVDFDFGLDATMLDERTNGRGQADAGASEKSDADDDDDDESTIATQDLLAKTEVVNLAIIPHFDEEFERQQHLREHDARRHHRPRHRYRHLNEDLSGIHCVMQAMMGIAAISTVFGMLGAFFKQRILDQLRMIHW